MAAHCILCSEICKEKPKNQSESSIQCKVCQCWSHNVCVGKGKFLKLSPTNFKCHTCQEEEVRVPLGMDVDKKLNEIVNQLKKLDQLDDIKKAVDAITENMQSMGNRVMALEEKIDGEDGIAQNIAKIQHDTEEAKQYARINNVVITGIPDDDSIDPKQAVIDLGNYLGIDIGLGNIDTAHRLPTKAKGKPKPILVKFASRWCKEEIMNKVKEKNLAKNYIDSKKLGYTAPNQAVFINEHLTPHMQEIYYKGRLLKKEQIISNVYTRNGKVIVKKNSEDKTKTFINHMEDYKQFTE